MSIACRQDATTKASDSFTYCLCKFFKLNSQTTPCNTCHTDNCRVCVTQCTQCKTYQCNKCTLFCQRHGVGSCCTATECNKCLEPSCNQCKVMRNCAWCTLGTCEGCCEIMCHICERTNCDSCFTRGRRVPRQCIICNGRVCARCTSKSINEFRLPNALRVCIRCIESCEICFETIVSEWKRECHVCKQLFHSKHVSGFTTHTSASKKTCNLSFFYCDKDIFYLNRWRPPTYLLFPEGVRMTIRTLLILSRAHDRTVRHSGKQGTSRYQKDHFPDAQLCRMPLEVLHYLFQFFSFAQDLDKLAM